MEPTGSEIHVVLEFDGREITALFRERHAFRSGDRVHLEADRDHLHLFDRETGERLG